MARKESTENYAFLRTIKKYINGSVLLIFATVAAIIVANSAWFNDYQALWQMPVKLSIGELNFFNYEGNDMTLGQVVNDFLMAIFFLSVSLEIKREILCGELSSLRKAIAPVIGACGGMLVPVLVFFLVCPSDPVMERGMAIPMATDIAFSLGVLSLFYRRCPLSLKIFLAALAVTDDLGGIIVIAVKYTEHLHWTYLGCVLGIVALLILGNWQQVRSKFFYLGCGIALWYCMLNSGIHATMAGVILAFCVPANVPRGTKYYLARIHNEIRFFPSTEVRREDRNKPMMLKDSEISMLKRMESASDHLISPLQNLEDALKSSINYFIIPLFAFANAGVNFSGMSLDNLFSGVGLAVFLGLFVGKFLGVLGFSWIFVKLKVMELPEHSTWASFASICVLCGIGFTVSMFMTALSYPAEHVDLLNDAKLGIICGSVASGLVGCLMLHLTLPKENVE